MNDQARIRSIDPLDAVVRTVTLIRPTWTEAAVLEAIRHDARDLATTAARAIAAAADPEVITPGRIRSYQPSRGAETPIPSRTVQVRPEHPASDAQRQQHLADARAALHRPTEETA